MRSAKWNDRLYWLRLAEGHLFTMAVTFTTDPIGRPAIASGFHGTAQNWTLARFGGWIPTQV